MATDIENIVSSRTFGEWLAEFNEIGPYLNDVSQGVNFDPSSQILTLSGRIEAPNSSLSVGSLNSGSISVGGNEVITSALELKNVSVSFSQVAGGISDGSQTDGVLTANEVLRSDITNASGDFQEINVFGSAGTSNVFESGTGASVNTRINGNGDITTNGDITAFASSSDIRLKENIKLIEDPLYKLSKISGYNFNYKSNPDVRVSGLIAQEVIEVLPEVVYETQDGNYAIRYGNVVGLLVEAIKSQQSKIEELEKRIEEKL